ncbi:hypothetical protein, partial [Mesorhizobium sp. WSM3224]|uniref:hypothetical protein n=1 Tax=Mesorhizobium sp. WSM3224 TaxID=1040986 RepID=UPI001AEBF570
TPQQREFDSLSHGRSPSLVISKKAKGGTFESRGCSFAGGNGHDRAPERTPTQRSQAHTE